MEDAQELEGRIRTLFERDERSPPPLVTVDDIPFRYEDITPEWMTAVICAEHPGAQVSSVKLGPPDDGTSNRRRIFLDYNERGRELELPASVFCKASQDLLHRLGLALVGGTYAEVTFFRTIRDKTDINTPRAFLANYDPESFASILVLEDLGQDVCFCSPVVELNLRQAQSLVALLANLHGRFWTPAYSSGPVTGLQTWQAYWSNCLNNSLMEFSNKGFIAAQDVIPPRLFKRYEEVWPAMQFSVDAHAQLDTTVLHGDCHFGQWFVAPEEDRMGVTDWQCCCIGNWARDVAYALGTSLTPEQRRAWERPLLQTYLDTLASKGVAAPALEEAWVLYRQNLLSALTWWTATLIHAPTQPEMQPVAISLEYIRRLSTAIDDLDALDACQG